MKLVIFSLFLIFFIIGCESIGLFVSPIVTGITYWVNGEAHRYYEQEPQLIYNTTKHVLHDLNIPITKDFKKNNRYYIVAGEKNKFNISIQLYENKFTKFSNRVNFFGDKQFAELIYKKVDESVNIIYFNEKGHPTKSHKQ